VTAAAVAEVRAVGEHALRQALKLVRANRSMLLSRRRRGVAAMASALRRSLSRSLLLDKPDQRDAGTELAGL